MLYDLILRGGRVIDPAQSLDGAYDVAIREGRIAAILPSIAPSSARETIDVSGKLVLPGLIDTHAHVFQYVTGRFGLEADLCGVRSGVTTLVDQGGPSCMYSKLAYDVFKDLAPVTRIAAVQNVLVVNPEVAAGSMKEFIALARAKPGTLNFGSPGNGSQAHVGVELLKMQLGLDLVHLPYQGVGPAMKDLLGGRLQLMLAQVPSALPQIKAGKLRPLGVASSAPLAALPEVPTIAAAAGLPGYEAVSWYALMAPAGTPHEVISKIHTDVAKVLQFPEVRERLAGMGAEPSGEAPAELAARIKSEYERWGEVVRKANIKAD